MDSAPTAEESDMTATYTPLHTITDDTPVVLTVEPYGPSPERIGPEPLAVIEDALSLVGLARRIGRIRLGAKGTWTFTDGDEGFRLEVV